MRSRVIRASIAGLALAGAFVGIGPSPCESGPEEPAPAFKPPPYGIRDVMIPEGELPGGWKKLPPGPMGAEAQAALDEIREAARREGKKVAVVERLFLPSDSTPVAVLFIEIEGDGTSIAKVTAAAGTKPGRTFQSLGSPARFLMATGLDAPRKSFVDAAAAHAAKVLARMAEADLAPPSEGKKALEFAIAALAVDPKSRPGNAVVGFSELALGRSVAPGALASAAARAAPYFRAALAPDAHDPLDRPRTLEVQVALGEALLVGSGAESEARVVLTDAANGIAGAEPKTRVRAKYHLARAVARLGEVEAAFAHLSQALEEARQSSLAAMIGAWLTVPDFEALRADARWNGLQRKYVAWGAAFPGRSRLRSLRDSKDPSTRKDAETWLRANGADATPEAEAAVVEALRWLKSHQQGDGGWSCAAFGAWCDGKQGASKTSGPGRQSFDVGVTALAALAFLGAGYPSPDGDPEGFGAAADAALGFLEARQDKEGRVGEGTTARYVYNHAAATLAFVEGYGTTHLPRHRLHAQRALDFIAVARNPQFVWRYGIKPGDNDTSVTTLMTMALRSAALVNEAEKRDGRSAAFTLDADAWHGIHAWVEKMTDDQGRGGYQIRGTSGSRLGGLETRFPAELCEGSTAQTLCDRLALGQWALEPVVPVDMKPVAPGARLLTARAPRWEGDARDFVYWYFGTLALREIGGEAWSAWLPRLLEAVVPNQHRDGTYCDLKGSWDPVDAWGEEGGRVYATAILALTLEAPYRYAAPRVAAPK